MVRCAGSIQSVSPTKCDSDTRYGVPPSPQTSPTSLKARHLARAFEEGRYSSAHLVRVTLPTPPRASMQNPDETVAMVVIVSSDTPLEVLLGYDEFLKGGARHEGIVLLLAKSVPLLHVLVDEGGVANQGRSVRVGEPCRHGRVVCRVLAIVRTA